MKTLANHYRQWDEDPYMQAHPAPAAMKPGSAWVDVAWVAFGVTCFALSFLIGTVRQAHP